MDSFVFVAMTYFAIVMFVGGTLYRALRGHWVWSARGDYRWTTRSTGFFGRASIGPAVLCLHWGIIILFVAHVVGFVGGAYNAAGAVEFFRWVGLVGGLLFLYGVAWALARRLVIPQLRAMSNADDYISLLLLLVVVSLGLYQAAVQQIFGVSYAAGPWLASVLKLQPDPQLMAGAPLSSKLHIFFALVFFSYLPFSKLAHVVSFPFSYFARPFISMRSYWGLKN
jgi:respiratory nitrate reductase gamma subunit